MVVDGMPYTTEVLYERFFGRIEVESFPVIGLGVIFICCFSIYTKYNCLRVFIEKLPVKLTAYTVMNIY